MIGSNAEISSRILKEFFCTEHSSLTELVEKIDDWRAEFLCSKGGEKIILAIVDGKLITRSVPNPKEIPEAETGSGQAVIELLGEWVIKFPVPEIIPDLQGICWSHESATELKCWTRRGQRLYRCLKGDHFVTSGELPEGQEV